MKKFFIIVVLAIISTNVFSTEVAVNDTTALTFNKVYEDVKEGIQGLAVALKAPAEHVYKVVVRQQTINSISYLLACLILILPIFTFNWWNSAIKSAIEKGDDETGWLMGIILLCILPALVGGIVLAVAMPDIITGFINPEYGAIRDVMNFIK